MKKALLAAAVIIFCGNIYGSSAGITSALDIAAGVKSLSMGGAYTAAVNDASCLMYNPGALQTVERIEIQGAYNPVFYDTFYDYFAAAIPTVNFGTFGFSFGQVGTKNLIFRDSIGIETGSGTQNLLRFDTGWAMNPVIEELSAGLNLKIQYQEIGSYYDISFGADMGAIYTAIKDDNQALHAGVSIINLIEPTVKLRDTTDMQIRQYVAGASYNRKLTKEIGVTVNADFVAPVSRDFEYRAGLEAGFFNMVFLRGGYNSYNILTAGAGIYAMDLFFIDYCAYFNDIELRHFVSAGVRLGDSVATARANKEAAYNREVEAKAKELAKKELGDIQKKLDSMRRDTQKQEYFKAYHYSRALEAYNNADIKTADAEFQAVFAVDPDYLNIRYYRGLMKSAKGSEGQEYSEEILALYRSGVEKYMKEDFTGAKADWEKIIKIDPYNRLAIENLKEVNDILRKIGE